MPQASPFISTDPNAGGPPPSSTASASPFLSTDPNAGHASPMTFAIVNGQRVPVGGDDATSPPSLPDLALEAAKGWLSGVNPLPALKQMYDSASVHYSDAEQAAKDGRYGDVLKDSAAAAVAPGLALVKGAAESQWAQFQKAREAFQQGRISEATGHTLAAVLPFLGPMAAQSGEAIGSGDPRTMARGVGLGAAALTPTAVKYGTEVARTGSLAPSAADVAAAPPLSASVPGVLQNRNPAEADAMSFAAQRGIPVDAGTATGNPALRGARYLADRSLGGSLVNAAQAPKQAAAFARVGSDLADATHPTPIVPTEAGADVRGAVATMRDQLDTQADAAYDRLRGSEADLKLSERLPTAPPGSAASKAILQKMAAGLGTEQPPNVAELRELHRIVAELESQPFVKRSFNETVRRGGDLDVVGGAAGAPVYHDILQAAPGTADMTRGQVVTSIRNMLETGKVTNAGRGALDVARARLGGGSGVSAPTLPPDAGDVGYSTGRLESVRLPVDVRLTKKMLQPIYDQMSRQMPLTQRQASPGLQAIGNILDGPDYAPLSQVDRDLSTIKSIARSQGGLAKIAVQHLDTAVRQAAQRGGPAVVQALEEGRAATVAKYGAQAVLDKLRTEPRQTFDQLTSAKDSAVEHLKAVRELAPQEMPKIGRAYLEDLLQTATAEGGFSRGQGLFAKWQRLGPQTKQILFGNPSLVHDLDRFFLLAKKAGENPNPSGTGASVALLAQGGLILTEPVAGLSTQVGAAALAKLLHSQPFVRAVTKGFTVSIGDKAAASAVTSEVLAAAKSAGVVLPMAADNQASPPPTRVPR